MAATIRRLKEGLEFCEYPEWFCMTEPDVLIRGKVNHPVGAKLLGHRINFAWYTKTWYDGFIGINNLLSQIRQNFSSRKIIIVTGYKNEVLQNHVDNNANDITFIHNEEYSHTNNMFSAHLGLQNINFIRHNIDEEFKSREKKKRLSNYDFNNEFIKSSNKDEVCMEISAFNNNLFDITKYNDINNFNLFRITYKL